jgi:hypothetical protein
LVQQPLAQEQLVQPLVQQPLAQEQLVQQQRPNVLNKKMFDVGCQLDMTKITFINPLSVLTIPAYKKIIPLLNTMYDRYQKYGADDMGLSKWLSTITSLQLFNYYFTSHLDEAQNSSLLLMTSFLLTQSIYNDYSSAFEKRVIDYLQQGKFKEIIALQKKMLQFFDYDFYRLPLTINYLILFEECLPEGNEPDMEKVEKKLPEILDEPLLLSMSPYDFTVYLIQDFDLEEALAKLEI